MAVFACALEGVARRYSGREWWTDRTTALHLMELDAASFVRACREGGALIERWLRAFDAQWGTALYKDAATLLKNPSRAEDVVQDALVKVWQRCATFRGDSQPFAWVRQIVRNAVLDALRSQPPEEPLQDDEGFLTPAAQAAVVRLSAEQGAQPDDMLDQHVLNRVYLRCWARFSTAHPEHAAVLRWVVEDGMEQAELAALLGRSPGATREYISQCRKKARPYLAEWRALVSSEPPRKGG
jgi:RNA polymerase sigma factor (sigma-70 family)